MGNTFAVSNLCICPRVSLFRNNRLRLPIACLAFVTFSLVFRDQVSLESKVTPRYRRLSVAGIGSPSICSPWAIWHLIGNGWLGYNCVATFGSIRRQALSMHRTGKSVYLLLYAVRVVRGCWQDGKWPNRPHISLTLRRLSWSRYTLSKYARNSGGPIIEPWTTPAFTGRQVEKQVTFTATAYSRIREAVRTKLSLLVLFVHRCCFWID